MHKININLHNLKTALIFSMEISRDYSSRLGLHMCQIIYFFAAPRPRSEGGVESTPPPGCEMGSKDPASFGLSAFDYEEALYIVTSWILFCLQSWSRKEPKPRPLSAHESWDTRTLHCYHAYSIVTSVGSQKSSCCD